MQWTKATQPETNPSSFSLAVLLLKLKPWRFLVDVLVLVFRFPEFLANKEGELKWFDRYWLLLKSLCCRSIFHGMKIRAPIRAPLNKVGFYVDFAPWWRNWGLQSIVKVKMNFAIYNRRDWGLDMFSSMRNSFNRANLSFRDEAAAIYFSTRPGLRPLPFFILRSSRL